MKAVVYEGVGRIGIKDVEKPVLVTGGMIIRVESCAICGTDLKAYVHGNPRMKPPVILGHEFVGRVTEVGEGISGFKTGDRITMATSIPCGKCYLCLKGLLNMCEGLLPVGTVLNGAFAEYMLIPPQGIAQGNVILVPNGLTSDEGALAEPLSCVINGQEIVNVGPGDTVVVIGAGPIGYLHVELAKARGAKKVFLVQRSKKRLEFTKNFGVDETVCSGEEDPVIRIMNLTGNKGADVVIVAAPDAQAQAQSIQMASKGGRISFFSSIPKDNPFSTINTNLLHYRELKVCGSSDSRAIHQKTAIDMLASGKINAKSLITHRFPLDKFQEALEIMKKKEGLKIIINP
jgi:L-iditol 2-dehydrogenase